MTPATQYIYRFHGDWKGPYPSRTEAALALKREHNRAIGGHTAPVLSIYNHRMIVDKNSIVPFDLVEAEGGWTVRHSSIAMREARTK